MATSEGLQDWAAATRRWGIALVFLWFGINEIVDPGPEFERWVPDWGYALSDALPALGIGTLIRIHGFVEVFFALVAPPDRWTPTSA